ncbi:TPA: restriction endonuclease subunit S [Pseudomonas aeruginosa]|nr:restriction endonuclease subunit S [Pseudomonas aeruginosa]EKU4049971.1 restriction endonuclease subunit S [Pseudomonas aeruginosa]EKX7955243.1 restriction endonuclease subunit S [Pseudomonas aeruginosa]EKX9336820.1 restriction endonuclease subunit S [Pseudomonas aeruginosa]HBO5298955.1 restriction endonuclease subunit S [Pseudomonas aeruginosa]
MTFSSYPDYKESGLDWLPEVPAHWVDRKIARDIPFVVGWTPPSGKDEYYGGELPWVTIADMTQMSVEDTRSKISLLAVQDKGAEIVPAGSMLFSFKLSVGKVAFLTIDSYTNEAIAGFLPSGPLDLDYWKYAAPEFIPKYGRENIYGATLLNQELISAVRFFAPCRAEQTQIARFLDHETARIGALIEEQQRLIELLKEKRQAVISHAVTKGLDPTVPMKDSGVEWLGEVPAHWTVTKLKFVTDQVVDCPHETPIYDPDGDYLVIRTADIDQGVLKPEQMYRLDREQYTHRTRRMGLEKNDVVYSREGERWGHAALVPQDDLYALGQRMMQLRVCGSVCPEFFMYQLNSVTTYRQGEVDTVGATAPHVNISTVINYCLMRPPIAEQREISQYLSKTLGSLDCLLGESLVMKGLLQERRSALISAAVTGKIDVRGWQPPASTQAPKLEVAEAV